MEKTLLRSESIYKEGYNEGNAVKILPQILFKQPNINLYPDSSQDGTDPQKRLSFTMMVQYFVYVFTSYHQKHYSDEKERNVVLISLMRFGLVF
jgi:hypothetical protein